MSRGWWWHCRAARNMYHIRHSQRTIDYKCLKVRGSKKFGKFIYYRYLLFSAQHPSRHLTQLTFSSGWLYYFCLKSPTHYQQFISGIRDWVSFPLGQTETLRCWECHSVSSESLGSWRRVFSVGRAHWCQIGLQSNLNCHYSEILLKVGQNIQVEGVFNEIPKLLQNQNTYSLALASSNKKLDWSRD